VNVGKSVENITINKYNTVRVGGMRRAIDASVKVDWPLFVLGSFGVGKSAIISQYAVDNGYTMVDVRLSQLLPEDLGGLPYLNGPVDELTRTKPKRSKGVEPPRTVIRAMPDILMQCWSAFNTHGKPVLLFLDEINAGLPSIIAAAYQLVLDRKLAGYELPPGTRIVAAGNRADDRGVTYDMPMPMANRFMIKHFLGPTWAEFEDYALKRELHPMVMAFLRQNPQWLCEKINVEDDEGRNPTPRSWEAASRLLKHLDTTSASVAERMVFMASVVGDGAAVALEATLRLGDKLASFEDVMKDPTGVKIYKDDLAISYLQAMILAQRLSTPEEFRKALAYVERLPRELIGVFIRTLMPVPAKFDILSASRDVILKYKEFLSAGMGITQ
jgi:hypothetical protein